MSYENSTQGFLDKYLKSKPTVEQLKAAILQCYPFVHCNLPAELEEQVYSDRDFIAKVITILAKAGMISQIVMFLGKRGMPAERIKQITGSCLIQSKTKSFSKQDTWVKVNYFQKPIVFTENTSLTSLNLEAWLCV